MVKVQGGKQNKISTPIIRFQEGEKLVPEFTMGAGETYYIVTEWNWTEPQVAKDFSVTVYGFEEKVSVSHIKGLASDTLPVIMPKD